MPVWLGSKAYYILSAHGKMNMYLLYGTLLSFYTLTT